MLDLLSGREVLRRVLAWLLLFGLIALLGMPSAMAFESSVPGAAIGPWVLTSSTALPNDDADQGVATLTRPDGSSVVVVRGSESIPAGLRAQGWAHIGDPDSRAGYVLDAYQGHSSMRAKLFVITSPTGARSYYRHVLAPGESFHNSFAAFTPDRRWFASGEWGVLDRLLVFATPRSSAGGNLGLNSTIQLRQPMRDVQGCVFRSSTALVCSTDDHRTDLYPVAEQLLAVWLDHPVDGRPVRATVHLIGAVPQDPSCPTLGETEGLDIHGPTLSIAVNSPCRQATLLSTYAWTDRELDDD
jgi:hypothetical protein